MTPLRPYQALLVERIVSAATGGAKRICVQLPTGGGKSVVFAHLIRRAVDKDRDVLFMVHRRELVRQALWHLRGVGVNAGCLMAGEDDLGPHQVQVASIQTLCRRLGKMDFTRFGLLVVDECHHQGSRTYTDIARRVPTAYILGFTATPIRKSGEALGDVFDALVTGPSVAELQAAGYLCRTEYMSLEAPDLRDVNVRGGDYGEKDLSEKVAPKLIGGVVDHYLAYGGRKGIIFTCGQKHSFWLREEFARHGRSSIVIDSHTREDERGRLESSYRDSATGILINCGIFTEGYDVPDCDTLVLARPTKSLGLYLQMVGRGLRPARGKTLLIIDHGANVYRHGFAEDARDWRLAKSKDTRLAAREAERLAETEIRERIKNYAACPECGSTLTGPTCRTCGREMTRVEISKRVTELAARLKILRNKKPEGAPARRPGGMEDGWKNLVRYAALTDRRLGYAVRLYLARYGSLPWQDAIPGLPRGKKEWGMLASEWMRRTEEVHGPSLP